MEKRTSRRTVLRPTHVAIAVAASFAPWAHGQTPPPNTLPTGGVITQGSGAINAPVYTPASASLQIDQTSARLAAQFGSFSIGQSAHVNVSQPASSSVALFKDVGGSLSQIYGGLTANGQIFISNQNGVLFGSTARVEVGSLFASNLSINETDFMEGRYNWYNAGATGTVTNQGTIITPSGYTVLAGPQVRNDGIIVARTGTVALAAGDRVTLDLIGDNLISVSVDGAALKSVVNTGTIDAEGGTVLLTARNANALLDTVVNAGGVIRATALVERNGEIVLDGGSAGLVNVAGSHQAGSASVSGANISMSGTIVTDLGSGSQTITTPGTLSIQAGGGSAQNAGLIHQGSGEQRVTAGNLLMVGGTGIQTRALLTSSDSAANQTITVAGGNISLAGGGSGDGNQAIIRSAGNQTIDGNANITLTGGASSGPGGANTAFIVGGTANAPGKTQTINAGTITMRSGAGGFQNGAVIAAPRQEITTTGDVLLAGGGTGGQLGGVRMGGLSTGAGGIVNTATDLTLTVGNDLLLSGGVAPTNSANIGSTTGLPQTITINAARDVIVGASPTSAARIGTVATSIPSNGTPGAISVTAGRDIRVNGGGEIVTTGTVTLKATNGAVSVNATSPTAGNARIASGSGQDILAQSVSLASQFGRLAQMVNSGGNQTVTASAVDIRTQAGGGTAEIRNSTVGEQIIDVAGGSITLRGADSGSGRASIFSGGNQTINGNPDLFLTGGGTGVVGAGTDARIETALGTSRQTIHAGRIVLENSALANSGTFAGFNSSHQDIATTGDVIMSSGTGAHPGAVRIQGGNGATDLDLNVGGSLLLTGGNAPGGGVGLGSSNVSNNITVVAARDVILNSGVNGARIGSSSDGTVGGNISISARNIELNGTASTAAIRTLDSVSLHADQPGGTISQSGNGLVLANSLITSSHGSTTLTGPNEIASFSGTSGGPLTLVDAGTLQVTGVTTTNDTITLTTDSLTNAGVITNGGGSSNANVVLNANTFNLAGGSIEAGAAAVILRPRDGTRSFGIESAGATTLSNADIASIHTSDFVVFGSGMGTTFTGDMTIGANAVVDGAGKHMAFFRSSNPGGTTTIGSRGVSSTGNVIVSAGGGAILSNGGTVVGNQVQLRASQGIGTAASRMLTEANRLAINNTGPQGAFVFESNDVTLGDVNLVVGGIANNVTNNISAGGPLNLSAGDTVNVVGPVASGGTMTVTVAGALNVTANTQDAVLSSVGGQSISARSLAVTSSDGRVASVWNSGGAQTINLSNGAGLDVQTQAFGGSSQIRNDGGGSQTVNVVNGDHINVNGIGGVAGIYDFGGTQSLSITGNGANAITLGAPGSFGPSQVIGGVQSVTAGTGSQSGSITVVGGNGNSTFTGFSSGQIAGGTQTVSTSGTLRITGGDAPNQPPSGFATGLFHNGSGEQRVSAASIEMQGGSSGINNTAIIISSGGANTITPGSQVIDVAGGDIELAGGLGGNNNTAIIVSFADQTVTGDNVELRGGAGGAGNGAFINIAGAGPAGSQLFNMDGDLAIAGGAGGNAGITGSATRQQTIFADNIRLTNSAAGGINSVGFIQGGHQEIHAAGDVSLTARAAGGDLPGVRIGGAGGTSATATDLRMFIGGDLVLTGGTAVNNGVGIGSTAAVGVPPLENNITINAQGSVILNSGVAGSGARIGSPQTGPAPGSISITAGGDINLNGIDEFVTIRTLGNVALNAASISEGARGRIIAGTLSTATSGSTLLTGPNEVANFSGSSVGDVTLNNTGALNVTSLNAGTATLTNSGDVTLTGFWNSFAATSITTTGPSSDLDVNSFVQSNGPMMLNVDGAVRVVASGVQDASLTAFGGQSINARSVEITSLDGRFASIGNNISGDQTITVSGGGVDIDSLSGNGFAFITNSGTGGQLIGVSDGSGIHVRTSSGSGSGQINNFGTGNQTINVSAGGGVDVRTLSGTGFALISNAGTGNQAISVTGGTGIDVVSGGGFASIGQNALGLSQAITATNADHINVNGVGGNAGISASGPQTLSITGSGANAITVGSAGGRGFSSVGGSGQTITAGATGEQGSITVIGADAPDRFVGISSFTAQGTPPRGQSITTAGTIAVIGGNAADQFIPPLPRPQVLTTSTAGIFNNSNAQQTISAGGIVIRGGASGLNNGAFISSNAGGDQYITVPGAISITGGAGGDNNRALILGSGSQTISGNPHIALTGGSGSGEIGNNGAFIIANAPSNTQTIRAADITVSSGGGGINNGAGITGTKQFITTTGDVIMSGAASTGQFSGTRVGGLGGNTTGPTDLTMDIGGSLLMTGGTAEFNGASIGSTLSSPALPNIITIDAGGNVVLNPGTAAGARIGSSTSSEEVALGSISITAGGKIELNGNSVATPTAIRTLGHVTLSAGTTISEGSHGRVEAGNLTTTSTGVTSLTGPNKVASFNATSTGGDVSLSNTGLLDVTGMSAFGDATINNIGDVTVSGPWNAGGTSTITVGSDIVLQDRLMSRDVVLTANNGDIVQAPEASIEANTLTTTSTGNTHLDGVNAVETISVSSTAGDIRMTTSSPLLTLASMSLPGDLLVKHTGAVAVRGEVSALTQDIRATGDVTVGSADAHSATLLYAPGDISISTLGSILVRGSDTTAGASSAVLADGHLRFSAGNVSLVAGDAAFTPVVVRGGNGVEMTVGNQVKVTGGGGLLSPALLSSGRNIDLTIGQALRIDAGSGLLSLARVQTELRDGVIRLTFPNSSEGGYFVNGVENDPHHGQTGFFTGFKPAKVGRTLLLEYAD